MHVAPSEPIGLQLISTAHAVSGALDRALVAAGGSLKTWRVLVAASGNGRRHGAPSALADTNSVSVVATSDDISRLETAGLVVRKPDTHDAQGRELELTAAGKALFHRLLRVVVAYDARLRAGLTTEEIDVFSSVLQRLRSRAVADDGRPTASEGQEAVRPVG